MRSHLCWIVSNVRSFSSISPELSCSVFSRTQTSKPAQAEISPTDLQRHNVTTSVPRLSVRIMPELSGRSSLTLPVLVDEALVLCLRVDGRQGRRHLPVELHHFMLQERADVEILLQDLLPWSRWCKWENNRVTRLFDRNIFVTVALWSGGLATCYIGHLSLAGIKWNNAFVSIA